MIPLRDNIPTGRFPVLTVALIVINVVVFIWQWQFPLDRELERAGLTSGIDQSSVDYGAIPYRITHPSDSDCFLGGGQASDGSRRGGNRLRGDVGAGRGGAVR